MDNQYENNNVSQNNPQEYNNAPQECNNAPQECNNAPQEYNNAPQEYNNIPQCAPNNNMAIAALVCGILGIIGSFIPIVNYFTTVLAILGVVFGAKAKKAAIPGQSGMGTAGLVLGIVGCAFAIVGVICSICVCAAAGSLANELANQGFYY